MCAVTVTVFVVVVVVVVSAHVNVLLLITTVLWFSSIDHVRNQDPYNFSFFQLITRNEK